MMAAMVPLHWGDSPATWDGDPMWTDPDEWEAMERRLFAILNAISRKPPAVSADTPTTP